MYFLLFGITISDYTETKQGDLLSGWAAAQRETENSTLVLLRQPVSAHTNKACLGLCIYRLCRERGGYKYLNTFYLVVMSVLMLVLSFPVIGVDAQKN